MASQFALQVQQNDCLIASKNLFVTHAVVQPSSSLHDEWMWQALSTRQRTKLLYDDVARSN
jgi:hypothetical protein